MILLLEGMPDRIWIGPCELVEAIKGEPRIGVPKHQLS